MATPPDGYVSLAGSDKKPLPLATRIADADAGEHLTVSVYLRRRTDGGAPVPPAARRSPYLSLAEFEARYGASPDDAARVTGFADAHGLRVEEISLLRRTVVLAGTVAQMIAAFGVDLGRWATPSFSYRGRVGPVFVPAELAPIIVGVLGLDNRPVCRHRGSPGPSVVPVTPPQVAAVYDFPTGGGSGQTIAIVELGGGFVQQDLINYFSGLGLAVPAIQVVGVDGAGNAPTGNATGTSPDSEVFGDIAIAGAIANSATIIVHFGPNTGQGTVDTYARAVTSGAAVVSTSWGEAEDSWDPNVRNILHGVFQEAVILGVSVFAASGDQGVDDGVGDGSAHVDYPASDPLVTGCGGTSLTNVSGSTGTEGSWGSSGGGISNIYPLPIWQAALGLLPSVNDNQVRRGVPDVAGNASNLSPYVMTIEGSTINNWGTSLVSPLYAGLTAVCNALAGYRAGTLNPLLYASNSPAVVRDVADEGYNGVPGITGYYAMTGWDAVTGLGSLRGDGLLSVMRGTGCVGMTWKGVAGDQGIYHTVIGAGPWAPPRALTGFGSSAGPALATGGALGPGRELADAFTMAWKGVAGDNGIYVANYDGVQWSGQERLPLLATTVAPALANGIFLAWVGQSPGDQAVYWTDYLSLINLGSPYFNFQLTAIPGAFSDTTPALCTPDPNQRLFAAWRGVGGDSTIWWASYDLVNGGWTPATPVPGAASSDGPALGAFNGVPYLVWKGEGNDQGIYWSAWTGSAWSAVQNIPGVGTSTRPALAALGGGLYMAWKGVAGDPGLYWSAFDGSTWTAQHWIAGGFSDHTPGLVAYHGILCLTWTGYDGDQSMYWSSSGGFNGHAWGLQRDVAGIGTSTGPALTVLNGRILMVWKGIEGDTDLWFNTWDGLRWSAQAPVPDNGTDTVPALTTLGNVALMTWKGFGGDQSI